MKKIILSGFLLALFSACKKDHDRPQNPPPPIDKDLVYAVTLKFQDSAAAGDVRSATFYDADAYGPAEPKVDTVRLDSTKTWLCKLSLNFGAMNLQGEADEHLCCYELVGVNGSIQVLDKDSKGLPVGIETKWRSPKSGRGFVVMRLMHQPGTKNGECGHGETDIEVTYPLVFK